MSDLIERQAVLKVLKAITSHSSQPGWGYAEKIIMGIPAATVTGTQPSIDWSHVHPDFNWLARDADGDGHAYTHKPEVGDFQFLIDDGKWAHAEAFASYTPGNCDWRDSLIMRPGPVEDAE